MTAATSTAPTTTSAAETTEEDLVFKKVKLVEALHLRKVRDIIESSFSSAVLPGTFAGCTGAAGSHRSDPAAIHEAIDLHEPSIGHASFGVVLHAENCLRAEAHVGEDAPITAPGRHEEDQQGDAAATPA